MPRKASAKKREAARRKKALEKGWNSRAFIADSRNNHQVHETHRAYFDKIPGQQYSSINFDLYRQGTEAHAAATRRSKRRTKGATGGAGRGAGAGAGSDAGYGDGGPAGGGDPAEFLVVVHVVSTTGVRLPGAEVFVCVKHTGEVVGESIADPSGRAVVACRYEAWTAVPFYLEAGVPGYASAGLDFEVTARECAAQLALESEEDMAQREAMEKLKAEEARRAARMRFTVRTVVTQRANGRALPGAKVAVRTAAHGQTCGEGVTDSHGVTEIPCSHPHWDTVPLVCEVGAYKYVTQNERLVPDDGSSEIVCRVDLETQDEYDARMESEAAIFRLTTVLRDRETGEPIGNALVSVLNKASGSLLGRAETKWDGASAIEVTLPTWRDEAVTVDVRHDEYPPQTETIRIESQQHRYEVEMTSLATLQAQARARDAELAAKAEAAAEVERIESERQAKLAAKVEATTDHLRENDNEFLLTVYTASLATGSRLEGAPVTVRVRDTGQVVGRAVTDAEGRAQCQCEYPEWRHTPFLVESAAQDHEKAAKEVDVNRSPMVIRIALDTDEAVRAERETKSHEFQVRVLVMDRDEVPLPDSVVALRLKATGDELAEGITDASGTCLLAASLVGYSEQAMYIHVSADKYVSSASDVNLTSKHMVTEVILDTKAAAAAKRAERMAASGGAGSGRSRAERNKFSLDIKVVDASTKAPIGAAKVTLRIASTGREIDAGVSAEDGSVRLEPTLARWQRTELEVAAEKGGWVSVPQKLLVSHAGYKAQCSLVEPVPEGKYRLVLTWVEEPQDLDLHVLCPNGTDVSFKHPADAAMGVEIEIDDRSGYGPETARLSLGATDSWWRVLVHNYSPDVSIMVSHAQLAVIKGDRLLRLYNVPGSAATNEWWDVCGVHGTTGRIVETNYLVESQPKRLDGLRGVSEECDPDDGGY